MNWLEQLHETQPAAHALVTIACVCVLGMTLGSLKIRSIGLGTAGVLFAGILVGHFGNPVDHATLGLVKDAGLVLFVFTMGLQLGPGFFATLRQQGVKMNVLAAAIVALGACGALLGGRLAGFDAAVVPGMFAGRINQHPRARRRDSGAQRAAGHRARSPHATWDGMHGDLSGGDRREYRCSAVAPVDVSHRTRARGRRSSRREIGHSSSRSNAARWW
jgi:AspT/YidE/YbjL antiporter-like protein